MSLIRVYAVFDCADCACQFRIDIDTALARPLRWSIYDIAEDALRGEVGLENRKHRCVDCLRKADALHLESCADNECEGCKPANASASKAETVGIPVAAATRDNLGLRQPGESVAAYMLRKGIRA